MIESPTMQLRTKNSCISIAQLLLVRYCNLFPTVSCHPGSLCGPIWSRIPWYGMAFVPRYHNAILFLNPQIEAFACSRIDLMTMYAYLALFSAEEPKNLGFQIYGFLGQFGSIETDRWMLQREGPMVVQGLCNDRSGHLGY